MRRQRLLALAFLFALAGPAAAQRGILDGPRYRRLPRPQGNLYTAPPPTIGRPAVGPESAPRPAIMLTGYWAPSNEMLRPFSPNPQQNQTGWIGSNWEGRGYDVYAYFPEFPPCCHLQGQGDLEVDYQDTSADFWPLAAGIDPIAIMTFSKTPHPSRWEVELNNRNLSSWLPDFSPPQYPNPSPPDNSLPGDTNRLSTLPVQEIVDAIDHANLPVNALICATGNGGGFLSEFIGYHGVWYQDIHGLPTDAAWCAAAGHVHVGNFFDVEIPRQATKASLRALIRYVDSVRESTWGEGTIVCATTENSAGYGANLTATGSASIVQDRLALIVTESVPLDLGLFFYGPATTAPTPFGDGELCVAGPHSRVPSAGVADSDGYVFRALDLGQPPFSGGVGQVSAGTTVTFQYVYRDPAASAAGFNLSGALELTFAP